MAQFEIGGVAYKSKRLPAMTEAHITRRLAPVINGMLPQVIASVAKSGGGTVNLAATDTTEAAQIMSEFVNFVSGLSDADATYIISECCVVTERKQGDAWAPIWARGAQGPQFPDIRFPVMALIVFNVVKDAVIDFMPSLGLGSSAGAPVSTTSP